MCMWGYNGPGVEGLASVGDGGGEENVGGVKVQGCAGSREWCGSGSVVVYGVRGRDMWGARQCRHVGDLGVVGARRYGCSFIAFCLDISDFL